MAFALTVAKLKEALEKPGCPICRQSRLAADRAVDSFLWENVTDIEIRQRIIDAWGFCPEHTRLLVAAELSNTGRPLGVNIIYEQLGRRMVDELRSLQKSAGLGGRVAAWLRGFRPGNGAGEPAILSRKGECPICLTARENALNTLATLFEQFEHKVQDIREAYLSSDGVCLLHLRLGIEAHAQQYPHAAEEILQNAIDRLQQNSAHMQEFIRKNNWQYKDEKLTADENNAWRKTVGFFSSIPGDSFKFRKEEY